MQSQITILSYGRVIKIVSFIYSKLRQIKPNIKHLIRMFWKLKKISTNWLGPIDSTFLLPVQLMIIDCYCTSFRPNGDNISLTSEWKIFSINPHNTLLFVCTNTRRSREEGHVRWRNALPLRPGASEGNFVSLPLRTTSSAPHTFLPFPNTRKLHFSEHTIQQYSLINKNSHLC